MGDVCQFDSLIACRKGKVEAVSPNVEYIKLNPDKSIPDSWAKYLQNSPYKADIEALCAPLYQVGITYFLYIKRYQDGSQIEVTNNGPWSARYYQQRYYVTECFNNHGKLHNPGIYLWSALDCQEIFADIREQFNVDHGITIISKGENYNEFFHFASTPDNYKIVNFYINNLDLLKRFILFFKDKAIDILKIASKKRIVMPNLSHYCSREVISAKQVRGQFVQQTDIERYYLEGCLANQYLTKREVECLEWHIEGKTAAEIALILSLSKRTIEAHLDNAKHKLDCLKQTQLGYKLAKILYKIYSSD